MDVRCFGWCGESNSPPGVPCACFLAASFLPAPRPVPIPPPSPPVPVLLQGSSIHVVRRVAQQVLVTLRFLLRCAKIAAGTDCSGCVAAAELAVKQRCLPKQPRLLCGVAAVRAISNRLPSLPSQAQNCAL